ncbi:hypothetical protein [Cupriavidus necator]
MSVEFRYKALHDAYTKLRQGNPGKRVLIVGRNVRAAVRHYEIGDLNGKRAIHISASPIRSTGAQTIMVHWAPTSPRLAPALFRETPADFFYVQSQGKLVTQELNHLLSTELNQSFSSVCM